jgi:caleosin-related protein
MFVRLRRGSEYFVADTEAGKVYANRNNAAVVSRTDEPDAELAQHVLASAGKYAGCYARAIPGTKTLDDEFHVRGPLTQAEQMALDDGCDIPIERTALQLHLDFFDADLDGWITLGENYRGWRGLGFSGWAASVKALLSAFFFGKLRHAMAIDTTRFRRYPSTGIFDEQGRIDEEKLKKCLQPFDAADGQLSFDAAKELTRAGLVSGGQFRSLFAVCRRMNGNREIITKEQFRGLFDGSLLWRAASMTDHSGRRAKWLQPAAHVS